MNPDRARELDASLARSMALYATLKTVPSATIVRFVDGARRYRDWFERCDPERCSLDEVGAALGDLVGHFPEAVLSHDDVDGGRWKPSAIWQAHRRKALRLPIDGYDTPLLPNRDRLPATVCSLAYDLSDLWELADRVCDIPAEDVVRWLWGFVWPYTERRVAACRAALASADPSRREDPFRRIAINGRAVRFVSWRTAIDTHVTEDDEAVRGASTLCGGRLALSPAHPSAVDALPARDVRGAVMGSPAPAAAVRADPSRVRRPFTARR